MGLEALKEAIDGQVGSEPAPCTDPESLIELERLAARLDAHLSAAAGAFDASGVWAGDGARSAPAWIATP